MALTDISYIYVTDIPMMPSMATMANWSNLADYRTGGGAGGGIEIGTQRRPRVPKPQIQPTPCVVSEILSVTKKHQQQ